MTVLVMILVPMPTCTRIGKSDIDEPEIDPYGVPRFGIIYLCGAFWRAPNTGTDSRVSLEFEELGFQVYLLR